jgi:diguanylate cyclase (GGDEF)-like protein/PAS domain S-box-containing protein
MFPTLSNDLTESTASDRIHAPRPPTVETLEEPLDRLVRLAARTLDVPAAVLALADDPATPRSCAVDAALAERWAAPLSQALGTRLLSAREPLVVAELADHAWGRDSGLAELGIQACIGQPLLGSAGQVLGCLAVADSRPRGWTRSQIRALHDLADLAASELEWRRAVAREITEQRRTEQARLESEQRFRTVVESLGEGLFITDLDDRVQYANSRIASITGYTPEELVGKVAAEVLLPEEDRARVIHETHKRVAGIRSRYEVRHIRKDGGVVWLEVHGVPFRDADGQVVGTLGLFKDVTERKMAEDALRESERRFRLVTRATDDVIWDWDIPSNRGYWSDALYRVFGSDEAEVDTTADWWREQLHPEDRERVLADIDAALNGGAEVWTGEYRFRRGDGSYAAVFDRGYILRDETGVAVRMSGAMLDLTERRRVEEEVVRLAALARENPNPVLECDALGNPVHVNPAAEQISRQLGVRDVTGLLPRNHQQLVQSALLQQQAHQNVEVTVEGRIFSWTYRPGPGASAVYLFAVDITGQRMMEEQLRHDALHDALTGLPNRLLFMERLGHAILRSKRRESFLFAVLFLDLDRFKVVNDSLGHHVGDELLRLVAQRLLQCLRTEDTVARFGGDEFAILLEDIGGISDATRVAERIQAELAAPVNLSGFDVFTSASIGIALSSSSYERPEYLLRNADMAMYRAKAAGQARFEVFDRAMHASALSRLQLETDLRHALEREEFMLHYQPIVSLQTGRIAGVEALIRWAHPDRGWMAPDEFIPVAEETGLILPIGRWVLTESCRQLREWQRRFREDAPASVGVNLSAKQFSQGDLVEQIGRALEQSGLAPGALRLEITESAVMESADSAVGLMGRLKALGVGISMDDFGTGYSSLSYLHRFPLDALKIDRSFVARINDGEQGNQMVHTILTLARSLGVSAVAEGIETPEQLETLRRLECDLAQGFHFARPMDPPQLEALLAGRPRW